MQEKPTLDKKLIANLSNVIGATEVRIPKSELERILASLGIEILSDGRINSPYYYNAKADNKRTWLNKCLCNAYEKQGAGKVWEFIECILSPARYVQDYQRELYTSLLDNVNKVLMLYGCKVNNSGKLILTEKASSLSEVDERVNHLTSELVKRAIHANVLKYCRADYLRKDYYDAIFEAAKGLAEEVREKTGCSEDGGELFQKAFSTKNPLIVLNALLTENEISEYKGLKELLEAIFHLVRNPVAHTPKINWRIEESKALDILTVISFAYKYLDECYPMPKTTPTSTP